MEIAKLVLEFLKVLTWPAVTVALVLLFRSYLERILQQLSERLGNAETLKFGVLGQEMQISGTAKELDKERVSLAQSKDVSASPEKLLVIEQATKELNNYIADVVGLKLVAINSPIPLENLVHAVMIETGDGTPPAIQRKLLILAMTKEVEKVLASLRRLEFVQEDQQKYSLTSAGRDFFQRVADQQQAYLARFIAVQ